MTFEEVLNGAVAMLKRQGRVSYRALKRQFDLDDDYLSDLKDEMLYTQSDIAKDGERGLVWTGEVSEPRDTQPDTDGETRFQALLLAVIQLLQREKRMTYRTLSHTLGIDDALLAEIRSELTFKRLGIDEDGKGVVWISEGQPTALDPAHAEVPSVSSLTASVHPPNVVEADIQTNGSTISPEDSPPEIQPDESATITQSVRSSPEAERRQLTVMFCDLVGSTDLSGKLDPEDLREVVRAYQETAARVIDRYEGYIAQYLGDGLLIYFGFPFAHEDDAQRAVYTGLGIPDAVATLNTKLQADYGVELAVRIGVHTGPVVVGEMGGGGRHENLALGETPNIAARLEGLAQPNSAVISPVTARLVRRSFALEELGVYELKGIPEPMLLYKVQAPLEVESPDSTTMLGGGFDTLVGRNEEIGLLLRRWEQSKEGLGQVVLISGEAGIGKSSLVEGLRAHVREEGMSPLAFRCSPYHTNSAFYPIIETIQRALNWQPNDPADTKIAKFEEALQSTRLAQHEAMPLLASLLSLPLPERHYPVLELSPQQQRQQTQDMLVAWLLDAAERQAMLAVWEDLHWADPSTLEVLELFVEQAPTAAILHLMTFRPEFNPPWPPRSHLTPITLNHLERSQVEGLITRLARNKGLPTEVTQHIVAKTDGVPLYVEELTKMILSSDLLKEDGNHYVLTGSLLSVSIPDTLQDSLMARLDQMNLAREIAQLGAVLGREFPYGMILAIASQDEETVQASLTQLVEAELLYQRGRPTQSTYIFKHALIQDVAYASLLKSTRQAVHQRISELLETDFPEIVMTQPELLAYHWTEANRADQAVSYWLQAGQYASHQSAYAEAEAHLTQGLSTLEALEKSVDRVEWEIKLELALHTPLRATKGNGAIEVGHHLSRLRELIDPTEGPMRYYAVLQGLRIHHNARAEQLQALELAEEALSIAQQVEDLGVLGEGHLGLGISRLYSGSWRLANDHLTRCMTINADQQDGARPLEGLHIGSGLNAMSRAHACVALWILGYPDQAKRRIQDVWERYENDLPAVNKGNAGIWELVLYSHLRDWSTLHTKAEALRAHASNYGLAQASAVSSIMLGWSRAMLERDQKGVFQLQQGVEAFQASGGKLFQCYWLSVFAEICKHFGCPEKGLEKLDTAFTLMHESAEFYHHSHLYWLKGELLVSMSVSRFDEAEACFQSALEIAANQEAESLELRAATSLARLWQQQDKRQEAYNLLAPVYGWFTEGFDTADLKEAKALLTELEG